MDTLRPRFGVEGGDKVLDDATVAALGISKGEKITSCYDPSTMMTTVRAGGASWHVAMDGNGRTVFTNANDITIHVGEKPPSNAQPGALWYDINAKQQRVFETTINGPRSEVFEPVDGSYPPDREDGEQFDWIRRATQRSRRSNP